MTGSERYGKGVLGENDKPTMVSSDEELAKLLLPETVRHHIGLVHPELCAKLVIEAYRIGYNQGYQAKRKREKGSRPRLDCKVCGRPEYAHIPQSYCSVFKPKT